MTPSEEIAKLEKLNKGLTEIADKFEVGLSELSGVTRASIQRLHFVRNKVASNTARIAELKAPPQPTCPLTLEDIREVYWLLENAGLVYGGLRELRTQWWTRQRGILLKLLHAEQVMRGEA